MKNLYNVCQECGRNNREDFIRCSHCNAYLLDNSPWKYSYNLYAISGALLAWLILYLISLAVDLPHSYVFDDPISQAILCVASYGILVVLFKWRIVRQQIDFFNIVRQICNQTSEFGENTLDSVRSTLKKNNFSSYNNLIAYQRLQWIIEAMLGKSTTDSNVLEMLKQHSETDRDSLESSLYVTQFLIWLLPTAGFLGTVFGMTQALQSFSSVVAKSSDLGFNAGLIATAEGLGIAFHTTLVGLAAVIPLLAITTALRRKAQLFLEQADKFFLRLVTNLTLAQDDNEERSKADDDQDSLSPQLVEISEPDEVKKSVVEIDQSIPVDQ